jgi:uncharacterized protein (TIGR03437 family)
MASPRQYTLAAATAFAALLLAPPSPAATFYVATTGSDSNPGTLAAPFRNIQKAASLAAPGDDIFIRAGVYRETIRPAQSGLQSAPISFLPYNGESVTISGADPVSGPWTAYSGSIYRAPLSTDLGDGNQIFVDGQMMLEARWPNTSFDVSHPAWATSSAGSYAGNAGGGLANGQLSDPNLPNRGSGYWNGAKLHARFGKGWGWQTATITDSATSGQLSFTYVRASAPYLDPGPGSPYYLTGKLAELDAAGEWFRDANGSLYVWTPDGASPSQHLVEAKARQFAFDFTRRSFLTVAGLNLFAASIDTDAQTQNLVLDGLSVKYVSHFSQPASPYATNSTGLILNGTNHILRNSDVGFSAGDGVALYGSGHLVHNLEIHDTDYAGTYGSAIAFYGGNSTAAFNTVHETGRYGVIHSSAGGVRILNNEIYNYGTFTDDLGCTYASSTNGQGSELAYNLCHDTGAPTGAGIYLDNGSSNILAHHNVTWNVPNALIANAIGTNLKIYNNTFLSTSWGMVVGANKPPQLPGSEIKNNIFNQPLDSVSDAALQANLTGADPRFVDASSHNYQVQANSPAVSAGVLIPPYTDGYTGSRPDIGAYDHGLRRWAAGAGQTSTPVLHVASFVPSVAPGSMAFAFGGLADAGSPADLTIQLTDSAGAHWTVPALTAASNGSAFVIPAGAALGPILVAVNRTDGAVFLGSINVFPVAPGLFSADYSGTGLAAAYVIRVKPDGSQNYEMIATYDASGNVIPLPIDLGPATDQVFVVFGGTGLRNASSLANVSLKVGGQTLPCQGISSPANTPGIDYAGILLPRTFAGRGSVNVTLTVDGHSSNAVSLNIK